MRQSVRTHCNIIFILYRIWLDLIQCKTVKNNWKTLLFGSGWFLALFYWIVPQCPRENLVKFLSAECHGAYQRQCWASRLGSHSPALVPGDTGLDINWLAQLKPGINPHFLHNSSLLKSVFCGFLLIRLNWQEFPRQAPWNEHIDVSYGRSWQLGIIAEHVQS